MIQVSGVDLGGRRIIKKKNVNIKFTSSQNNEVVSG